MFAAFGRITARFAPVFVLLWVAAAAFSGIAALTSIGGDSLFDRLHTGVPRIDNSESDAGNEIRAKNTKFGEQLSVIITGLPDVTHETVRATVGGFHSRILDIEGVAEVVDPYVFPGGLEDPRAQALRATDGFVATVSLERDLDPASADTAHSFVLGEFDTLIEDLGGDGIASSGPIMVKEVTDQIQTDLQRGEAIALPVSLLIMIVVFGGFLAAGMPIVGAIASILGGLGVLLGFSYALNLDAVVVNVVTVLGLGLSIDYGLLIVSRYREELREALEYKLDPVSSMGHKDPVIVAAMSRTVGTAGRTVAFSAVTVAISVAGLMLFDVEILRSLGAAGVSVVVIALLSALTLVPAVLALLGRRMARRSALRNVPLLRGLVSKFGDVPPPKGVFSRLATRMQRHPLWAVLGTLVILGVLASPVANLELRNSTVALLPQDSIQRDFLETIEEKFPALVAPAMEVITEDGRAEELARSIAGIDDVVSVDPPSDIGNGWVKLGIRINDDDHGGQTATQVVHDIRDLHNGGPQFWVVGQAANQVDFNDALIRGMPMAAAVVVLATLVLLFLMTGSILVPIKALLINVVSLGASLGITSWIFGEGHLTNVLNFESAGGLESYVVAVVVAFGFGLAMDYEVFLLARMKEIHDTGADNNTAVRDGLQKTGRIITSAALVIIVVFAGFIAGDMLAIKQVGVALAVTVLIDATLVRVVLVPATMTLLGEWNWWAPKPLRKLHTRLGIHH